MPDQSVKGLVQRNLHASVELDEIDDLAGSEIDLDGLITKISTSKHFNPTRATYVVDLDSWVRVTDPDVPLTFTLSPKIAPNG